MSVPSPQVLESLMRTLKDLGLSKTLQSLCVETAARRSPSKSAAASSDRPRMGSSREKSSGPPSLIADSDLLSRIRAHLRSSGASPQSSLSEELSRCVVCLGENLLQSRDLISSLLRSESPESLEIPLVLEVLSTLEPDESLLPPSLLDRILERLGAQSLSELYSRWPSQRSGDGSLPSPLTDDENSADPVPTNIYASECIHKSVSLELMTPPSDLSPQASPATSRSDACRSAVDYAQYFQQSISEEEFALLSSESEREEAKESSKSIGSVVAPLLSDFDSPSPAAVADSEESSEVDSFSVEFFVPKRFSGCQSASEFQWRIGTSVLGRYEVLEGMGESVFSEVIRCRDAVSDRDVCLKVIRNNKDFLDSAVNEIHILRELSRDPLFGSVPLLRLQDYFYYKEHLFIVTECLGPNLYNFSVEQRKENPSFFSLDLIRLLARQILRGLEFIHSHGIIHCDLKPENVVIDDRDEYCPLIFPKRSRRPLTPSRLTVKIIDFGSAVFVGSESGFYIQSRAYRAPEVILGLPYDSKIDVWSLGCILAELFTGNVIFDYSSIPALLASAIATLGPIPECLLTAGREVPKYFVGRNRHIYNRDPDVSAGYQLLIPDMTSLPKELGTSDAQFLSFLSSVLQWDPMSRASAEECLRHPFIASAP